MHPGLAARLTTIASGDQLLGQSTPVSSCKDADLPPGVPRPTCVQGKNMSKVVNLDFDFKITARYGGNPAA